MSALPARASLFPAGALLPSAFKTLLAEWFDSHVALFGTDGTALTARQTMSASGIALPSATATTSGTSIDFTSLPSWVRRITVSLAGVSLTGTSNPILQIGDSGGVETSGYSGATNVIQNASGTVTGAHSTGFVWSPSSSGATVYHGQIVLTLVSAATNTWACCLNLATSNVAVTLNGAGTKSLSATLDRVRLTTVGGTDTFDAGVASIMYEG